MLIQIFAFKTTIVFKCKNLELTQYEGYYFSTTEAGYIGLIQSSFSSYLLPLAH